MEAIVDKVIQDSTLQEKCWRLYKAAFLGSNVLCSQNQSCFSHESFLEAMLDPDYLKFYLMEKEIVVALSLVTGNMEKARIAYINPEKLVRLFPNEYQGNLLFYIVFIGVDPALQHTGRVVPLIEKMLEYRENDFPDAVVGFDFSHATNKELPRMLGTVHHSMQERGKVQREFTYETLDFQEYGFFR
jgi:hypothetical protein